MTLNEKIIFILKKSPNQKFTSKELADAIGKEFQDWILGGKKVEQIRREINSSERIKRLAHLDSNIEHQFTTSPMQVWYNSQSASGLTFNHHIKEIEEESEQSNCAFSECDLYEKLNEFLEIELGLAPQRIAENTSHNNKGRNGNKWLHPDIVALEKLNDGWERITKECARQSFSPLIRIWSFEVKKKLNPSNVREYFFQTVSNSSWANESYIVAVNIKETALKEFRLLSGLHGVGLIELDYKNPTHSKILIPSKKRPEIDWAIVNRILEQNRNFEDFIKKVHTYLAGGYIH